MPGIDRRVEAAIRPASASHNRRDVLTVKDCINHVFYFLYSGALISRALLTLEVLPLPELANS